MQFSCKKCNTQYTIADEKVRGKVIKVRCKRCNHLIVVRSSSPSLNVKSPARAGAGILQDSSLESEFDQAFQNIYEPGLKKEPPTAPAQVDSIGPLPEPEWFYGLDGSEEGPYTLGEMEAKIRTGTVTDQHFIWRDGMSDWLPLDEVPELAMFLTYPGPIRSRRQTVVEPKKQKAEAKRDRTALASKEEHEKLLKQEKEIRQWKLHRRQKETEEFKKREQERKQRGEAERRRLVEEERQRLMQEDRNKQEEEERRRRYEREIKEWEKERKAEKERQQRQEALERKRREEAEKKEEEEARKKEREEAAKKEREEAEKREREEAAKKEREEARKKEREEAEKKEREEERKRLHEEEKKKEQEEKKRQEEERQRLKEQEREEKAKAEEAERWRQKEEEIKNKQEALTKKKEEERKKKEEESRQHAVAAVLKKREKVREDRHADRIAEHFFDTGDEQKQETELLPPPVIDTTDELPADLADTVQEEFEEMQADPMAILARRDQAGQSQLSKTTKMIVAQAKVASRGRRFSVGLLSVIGVLGILGAAGYLAFRQGWFGGDAADRLADSVEGSSNSPRQRVPGQPVDVDVSPEDAKRYRDTLWKVKQPNRPNRSSQPVRRTGRPSSTAMSSESRELLDFYQSQSEEKRELTPRTPDSLLAVGQQSINLPNGSCEMPDMAVPESKREVTPVATVAAGSQRLTDMQVRRVIQKHYHKVKNCLERQLKRDSTVSGKMYVVAKVKPNGRVQAARIATKKFHGTFVEECLIREVKRWDFPTFKGEAYELRFPLLLSARGEY